MKSSEDKTDKPFKESILRSREGEEEDDSDTGTWIDEYIASYAILKIRLNYTNEIIGYNRETTPPKRKKKDSKMP